MNKLSNYQVIGVLCSMKRGQVNRFTFNFDLKLHLLKVIRGSNRHATETHQRGDRRCR